MNAADPRGSPSDRGGGSSSTPPPSDRGGGSSSTPPQSDSGGGSSSTPPPSDRGGGSSSIPPGAGSQREVIEVDDSKAALVITPALVYDMKEEV